MIEATLGKLAAGQDLSMEEMAASMEAVMEGRCSEGEIGLLLTGLRLKGETVDEIAGAATAMRRCMTPIRTSRSDLIDTCGTGGGGSSTFNISTAAALVTAAAGAPVAKHGNRRVTSRSGSADVLQALGVNIEADVPTVEACLEELGVCFCFAPLLHASMKRVADVRRKLGFRSIFNMLGPLTNPAGASYQLIGVGHDDLRPLLASALQRLGTRRALVVRGDDGLGEVTLAGQTQVSETRGGQCRDFSWSPEDFGFESADLGPLEVAGPEQSAAFIRDVIAGKPGPARNITLMNAAAALWTVGKAKALADCVLLATEAVDSGATAELLARLVERSQG